MAHQLNIQEFLRRAIMHKLPPELLPPAGIPTGNFGVRANYTLLPPDESDKLLFETEGIVSCEPLKLGRKLFSRKKWQAKDKSTEIYWLATSATETQRPKRSPQQNVNFTLPQEAAAPSGQAGPVGDGSNAVYVPPKNKEIERAVAEAVADVAKNQPGNDDRLEDRLDETEPFHIIPPNRWYRTQRPADGLNGASLPEVAEAVASLKEQVETLLSAAGNREGRPREGRPREEPPPHAEFAFEYAPTSSDLHEHDRSKWAEVPAVQSPSSDWQVPQTQPQPQPCKNQQSSSTTSQRLGTH